MGNRECINQANCGTSDVRGKRNTAIIAMMAIYGMRSSEVANLKLKDIDWDKEQQYRKRCQDTNLCRGYHILSRGYNRT